MIQTLEAGLYFTIPFIPYRLDPPRGYDWLCLRDPSGYYRTRMFRLIDILPHDWHDPHGWPDGTLFQHIKSYEYKFILGGRIMTGFSIVGRCATAWQLYADWTVIAQQCLQNNITQPEHSRDDIALEYNRAIGLLRDHMKACPECQLSIKQKIWVAEREGNR